jgi:hypothetical protein
MFTILKKFLGGRPAKVRKAAAGFRPDLEALESRDLMSVAGYSPVGKKDFFIDSYNNLKERDQYGHASTLAGSVSQVSVLQGDSQIGVPVARADVVMLNGDFYEWDDGTGFKYIKTGVKQVCAGFDGNSAVLFTNGNLSRYNTDYNGWWSVAGNIASASIGLDLNGEVMFGMVTTGGLGYEWRGNGWLESLGSGVKQVSAGVRGHSALLNTNGDVYDHCDAPYMNTYGDYSGPGTSTLIESFVTSVSCGTDLQGAFTIDMVSSFGPVLEYDSIYPGPFKILASGVVEADAGWGGVIDLCYSNGNIARYNDNSGTGYADTLTNLFVVNRNFLG